MASKYSNDVPFVETTDAAYEKTEDAFFENAFRQQEQLQNKRRSVLDEIEQQQEQEVNEHDHNPV